MNPPAALALLEVLDRDGLPRQSLSVHSWPVRIGRALDNDLILSDSHVAAHHMRIATAGDGLALVPAESRNGVLLGRRRLQGGDTATLQAHGEPAEWTIGRTRLRLRLPGHQLAPEVAIAPTTPLSRRGVPIVIALLVLIAARAFGVYLDNDPDNLAQAESVALLSGFVGGAVWCAAWALLSKTFTRQAQFGWHLRVFLFTAIALLASSFLPGMVAFAFSWPPISNFDFVLPIVVLSVAFYFHLRAVEPSHPQALKTVALTCAVVGVALSMWFNLQRRDQLGDELYMGHLFPPAFRIARPVAADAFVDKLSTLRPSLDKKSRESGRGDDAGASADDDG